MLTDDERREIEAEMTRYRTRQAVCVDAMKIVQWHRGWVSDESLHDIAALLQMTVDELDGVATFYNLIFRRPVGRHVILVCNSVACWMLGAHRVRELLSAASGAGVGETSADGRSNLDPRVSSEMFNAEQPAHRLCLNDQASNGSFVVSSGMRVTGTETILGSAWARGTGRASHRPGRRCHCLRS